MASLEKYVSLVESFYKDYDYLLGQEIKDNIFRILEWVRDYRVKMNVSVPATNRIQYLHRGVSLLKNFSIIFEAQKDVIDSQLYTCAVEINSRRCTQQTLDSMKAFRNRYVKFSYDLIGCHDRTYTMILSIISSAEAHLDPKFRKDLYDLEVKCIQHFKQI